MPGKLPTHRPPRPRDATAKGKVQARRSARFLPYSGPAWQSIRRAQLERFPLCEDCKVAPAVDVDHNTNDTSRNLVGIDLSSLCHSCHSRRTNERMHGRKVFGCDVDGMPLDPDHHWNREKSLAGTNRSTDRPAFCAWPRIAGIKDS